MKLNNKLIFLLAAALSFTSAGSWAQSTSDPVVGGAIIAMNVDVVATTGYRATELLGDDIYNNAGDNIGKLDDFIVGSDASVSVAVIAVGGFLGVGARMVAVPASLLVSNESGQMVLPNATKDTLMALPEFQYVR